MRVDSRLFTIEQELHSLLNGEILLHVPIHVRTEIGMAANGIPAGDQSRQLVLPQLNGWAAAPQGPACFHLPQYPAAASPDTAASNPN